MILRPPSLADKDALAALGRDSFVAAFGHLYAPADIDAFLQAVYAPEAIAREIDDDALVYRVAEDESGLLAYCKLGLKTSYAEYAQGRRPIDLKQLYCRPGEAGRGIGAALMEWALAHAREEGADEMLLSVWAENHGAQRFYARYGFAKRADIHFMVGNHRDEELLYALSLS
jgi:GNAT superfamily N-acetyltransferase